MTNKKYLLLVSTGLLTGNLGVGTTSPGKQVDIYNGTAAEVRISTFSGGSVSLSQGMNGASLLTSSTGTGGNLILGTAGLEKARIDTNGNLGIATSNPTEKLEVNGNIRLSGATPTFRVSNLSDPIDNADAANKKYVDTRVSANGGGAEASPYLSNGSYYSEGGDPYFCRLNILSGTTQQIVSVNQNKKCDTANDLYCNGGSCNATVSVVNELKQNGQLVSAAGERSCAVNNGQVYCWGYMGNGQLGNGGNSPLANASVIAYGASSVDEDVTKYSVALCETKDKFNGNLGGVDGANSICKSQCGMGYKFARSAELANFNAGVQTPGYYWIDSGNVATNGLCVGWTSESGSYSGHSVFFYAQPSNYSNVIYSPTAVYCNTLQPLLCVRGIR